MDEIKNHENLFTKLRADGVKYCGLQSDGVKGDPHCLLVFTMNPRMLHNILLQNNVTNPTSTTFRHSYAENSWHHPTLHNFPSQVVQPEARALLICTAAGSTPPNP